MEFDDASTIARIAKQAKKENLLKFEELHCELIKNVYEKMYFAANEGKHEVDVDTPVGCHVSIWNTMVAYLCSKGFVVHKSPYSVKINWG